MKLAPRLFAAALCLGLVSQVMAATELKHWPAPAAKQLNEMIAANANKGNYAVFDMDNTSYRFDLEESLLPYMENKGLITRDSLDPSLKLMPFKDTADHKESLFSYYYRLCEVDDMVCYPWVAQVFSGFTLKELKGYVDELMASGKPVPVTYFEGDVVKNMEVQPPKIFTGQTELYNKLMENGIDVYVMTAASEELVRMVASDPKYGYNVKPQNVIGVSTVAQGPQDWRADHRAQADQRRQIRRKGQPRPGTDPLPVDPGHLDGRQACGDPHLHRRVEKTGAGGRRHPIQ
jgi:phosphorylcholine phosphatase